MNRTDDVPYCCRCQEDFPLATAVQFISAIRMGILYRKNRFSKNFTKALPNTSDYLCGNCWFDLTDEDC